MLDNWLHLKASVNYTGKTSMVIGVRVESENIQTGEIKHCNSSYFTMVAKNEQGGNALVPGLILNTEDSIRRFSRSIKQQEEARNRSNYFKRSEFKIQEHLQALEKHNAKVEL